MNFITYILLSRDAKKTYVGHTNNLMRRLKEHNSGRNIFSKRYIPWVVIHTESFTNENNAIQREEYFKSAADRRWMRKNLFNE